MNFSEEIISWYSVNKRDLPWRNTDDPYKIWLSEVILQQTRVEQGMPYFYKFSERFPEIGDLAAAEEDEVLNLWQGLGYYSRGRNMYHTANQVMEEHGGYFPRSYEQLIKLKGIGAYTAAAIASFSSNEARAVVDGNVFRLLSRFFGIDAAIDTVHGKRLFSSLANELIDQGRAALFNQAIMEFGSLQCKPRNPDCSICPLLASCEAFRLQKIDAFPVKSRKQKVRNRFFNYVVARKEGSFLIQKREAGDIWQHLHEFPLFETERPVDPGQLLAGREFIEQFGVSVVINKVSNPVTHVLSHQRLRTVFIEISGQNEELVKSSNRFYAGPADLIKLAQPKLIFAFLKNYTDFHLDQL